MASTPSIPALRVSLSSPEECLRRDPPFSSPLGALALLDDLTDRDDLPSFDSHSPEMIKYGSRKRSSHSGSQTQSTPLKDSQSIDVAVSLEMITPATAPTKLKKKKSLGQALRVFSSDSSFSKDNNALRNATKKTSKSVPFPLRLEDKISIPVPPVPPLPSATLTVGGETKDTFEDLNRTVLKRNMPHQPFRPEDAPYMQAYTQMMLESDFYMHELLRRLNPNDSPTFHNYGRKPPSDVLDLGCGEGHWVLHAAKYWKSSHTKVTGLDLIDVHNNHTGQVFPQLEPVSVPKNVTWIRSNFVKYALPFSDDSFDLVRMADLSLCIPRQRWSFVFSQVRRVLRPGGRLELIDDRIFFPPIPPPPRRDTFGRTNNRRSVPIDSDSDEDSLYVNTPTFDSPKAVKNGHAHSSLYEEFRSSAGVAKHLETIFDNMLINKYGISPNPHEFLRETLCTVFGDGNATLTRTFQLAVPSRELVEGNSGRIIAEPKRHSEDTERQKSLSWIAMEWDKRDKRAAERTTPSRASEDSMDDPSMLDSLTPKAVQVLFGNGKIVGSRADVPYQPPGLLLVPSTLIPFSPIELEMHACKNMNTLLGCKYALVSYVLEQKGEDGFLLVEEDELDDLLWDYDRFRRKRFNWPSEVPGIRMEEEPEIYISPKPTIFRLNSGSSLLTERQRAYSAAASPLLTAGLGGEHMTHVRNIQAKGRPGPPTLQRIASLVKPIMRKRSWVLPVLAEFFPESPSLVGLNINEGRKILLRLRPAHSPDTFCDIEDITHTMLHELAHNVHGSHDEQFYKYLSALEGEYDALRQAGYAGEGFFSEGSRLGINISHNLPPHLARQQALAAAEKRRKLNLMLSGGGRLGGAGNREDKSLRELAAEATERRMRDEKACASGAVAQREAEKAAKDSVEDDVIDLTQDSDSESEITILESGPTPASTSASSSQAPSCPGSGYASPASSTSSVSRPVRRVSHGAGGRPRLPKSRSSSRMPHHGRKVRVITPPPSPIPLDTPEAASRYSPLVPLLAPEPWPCPRSLARWPMPGAGRVMYAVNPACRTISGLVGSVEV
ncbi:hypothetical protein A0H81_01444 [Grifola frondosa]|uniref:WLM domain-containing protein n=1 Tax=Grifola frondosa TaxID=5627 RepID=A0A1C7MRM6_GRIFR|nr:hypothetical protein A0H81_01444 [Grifola frondosa]